MKKYIGALMTQRDFFDLVVTNTNTQKCKSHANLRMCKNTEFMVAEILSTELRYQKEQLDWQKRFGGSVRAAFNHL